MKSRDQNSSNKPLLMLLGRNASKRKNDSKFHFSAHSSDHWLPNIHRSGGCHILRSQWRFIKPPELSKHLVTSSRTSYSKWKYMWNLLGYVSTGRLVITISAASCSRNCNFLTRKDLSFIFGYVVSIDMNFIHKKLLMLKL